MPAKWRTNLTTMPKQGPFEVMQVKEVFRHLPDKLLVIEPVHGRMFVPKAWRPLPRKRKSKSEE